MIRTGDQYQDTKSGRVFTVTDAMVYDYRSSYQYREDFDNWYVKYNPPKTLGDILQDVLTAKAQSKKFWMVKGNGPTGFKHSTKEAAIKEAERLAKVHPGKEFYVLETICIKKTSKMETTYL
jgi:hypothetical protein